MTLPLTEDQLAELNGELYDDEPALPPAKKRKAKGESKDAKFLDPASTAEKYIAGDSQDQLPMQRYWRGSFWGWSRSAYREQAASEARARLVQHLNRNFVNLTTRVTNDVLDQLKAQTILDGRTTQPAWLDGRDEWKAHEVLCCPNALIHLPSFVAGKSYSHPPTPAFFSTAALDFDFSPNAPEPTAWLNFLHEDLWRGDEQSVETLQDWFGYVLVADTRLQKMLTLIGPKRAGKGVIARVLRSTVGAANVAGPTLASFAQNFGLQALIGKSLAIISDARLSGRQDSAVVVERILSITGEDSLTIDKKYKEPITGPLSTRLMLLSNEIPRLADASGALASRMILLRLDRSFYGNEDHQLTDKLLTELPSILLWAIQGWKRIWERGHFVQPESAVDLVETMADLCSPMSAFVKDKCEVGPEHSCLMEDIYVAWCDWCKLKGRRESGTEQQFGKDIRATVPSLRSARPRVDGERATEYEGIRVRFF